MSWFWLPVVILAAIFVVAVVLIVTDQPKPRRKQPTYSTQNTDDRPTKKKGEN